MKLSDAEKVFHKARGIASPEERRRFVRNACRENDALHEKVNRLLKAHEESPDFLASEPGDRAEPTGELERPGTIIGRYKLLEQIGEGGFGVVFMAEQQEPVRRKVALKIIKAGMDTRQVIARFEAERQALALMDHPHIAKVHDAGATENGRPYFVMELVQGIPITQFCEERRLTIKERLELFVPVCQAIQHAHQKGVIHRDIKPSNVLVTLNDGVPHPMVIDFGVAKAIDQQLTEKTLYTRFAQMIGTPAYMSPEQAEMSKQDVDTRTDVYSLGVLLYELLTGETPFPEERLREAGYAEIQRIISQEEPVRPSTALSRLNGRSRAVAANRNCEPAVLQKLIKGDLDWIVLKAIEKDRTRRYETANGLAMDIRRHLNDEPVVARPPSSTYRFQKLVRRNKLTFAAGVVVAAALLLGAIVSTWQARRATHASLATKAAERHARQEALVARQNLYVSDIHLAQQALQERDTGRARMLLQRHIPKPNQSETNATTGGTIDLRGWEWRYLWGQLQGSKPKVFASLPAAVFGLDVSPDGRYLAASTTSGLLKVWELPSGKEFALIEPGNAMPTKPVWFPDSSRLIYHYMTPQATNGLLKIWDFQKQQVSRQIFYPTQIGPKAVSPDGQRILLGSWPGIVRLFDLQTGRLARWENPVLVGTSAQTSDSFQFAEPNGREWVLGGTNGDICVFDVEAGGLVTRWKAQSGQFTALKMSRDGRLVASAGVSIRVWNYQTHELLGELKGHRSWVSDIEFTLDGRRLVSSSADQTVRLWDLNTFTELATFRGADQEVWEVELSPDDQTIYGAGQSTNIFVWDATARPHKDPPVIAITSGIKAFGLSRSGARLVVLSTDGSVKTTALGDGIALTDAEYVGTDNSFVSLSPDGTRLIAGKTNGGIAVYSVATGELLHSSHIHSAAITYVRMLASGNRILSSDLERNLLLQKISGGKPEVLWEVRLEDWQHFDFQSLAVSSDERAVAAGSYAGRVTLWDLPTGKEIGSFTNPSPQKIIYGLAFSPDGHTLATADVYRTIRLWDTATRHQRPGADGAPLQGAGPVTFSPDGKRLISRGGDALIIWDLATRQELLRLKPEGGTDQLAFSADGNRLFALNSGTLYAWRAPP